jgi:3-phenylpropionate/trans-cinnamate dioxygenase ferredoxin component
MTRYQVLAVNDVPEGAAMVADAGDRRVVLCNRGGTIYAIDDICTHDGGPLGEGVLIGEEIECPRHGARFDVRTGRATRMPAVSPVQTYPVEEAAGDIYVDVADEW